ncbi:hypothetical protein FIBSPDRAFT_956989 [Athelia psychrophila]|uniref:NAD(P)-binding protein n=1 Tax=Athelia psychrophila TaxID=1759441 RepID=A0A166GD78_9AGAM|nr:hypothetical protein FIBSPDRAFT_956989 [Fibularhizoctonia sp. CBS 109695]
MAPVTNARHLFAEIPTGYPVPGNPTVYDASQTMISRTLPLNGGVLLTVLVVSIDPYMRGKMRDPSIKSYSVPYLAGEPGPRSDNPAFKKGYHLYGVFLFRQYIVTNKVENFRKTENKEGLPWSVYWDNVGGESLDLALANAAQVGARFIECGMISEYNEKPHPITHIINVLNRQISIHSFIVAFLEHKYDELFYKEVLGKIASGEIKYKEDRAIGLEKVGEAILDVQTGKTKGKSVVIVAEE